MFSQTDETTTKLHLVDLAGHEKPQGEQMAEAVAINKSLLTLGQVVEELASGTKQPSYRSS